MQTSKKIILTLIVFGCLFFLFGPEVVPTDLQPEEILNITTDNDVIIIFIKLIINSFFMFKKMCPSCGHICGIDYYWKNDNEMYDICRNCRNDKD